MLPPGQPPITRLGQQTWGCRVEQEDPGAIQANPTHQLARPTSVPHQRAPPADRLNQSGCWHRAWYLPGVDAARKIIAKRKITFDVPRDWWAKAPRASGRGITRTIREALALVTASRAYAQAQRLRGKVRFSREWTELKDHRGLRPARAYGLLTHRATPGQMGTCWIKHFKIGQF